MARVKEHFHNVQCDCCGELASETWWNNDDDARNVAYDSDFYTLGGRDYCPDCVTIDDDDNFVTKDGRKYDGNTHEEIDNSEYFALQAMKEVVGTDTPERFAECNATCLNVAKRAVQLLIEAREGKHESPRV